MDLEFNLANEMLERIRDHLRVIAPEVEKALLPAANELEINALKSALGRPLPEDLVAVYRESAGLNPDATANFALGFSFMDVATVTFEVERSSYNDDAGASAQFADKGIRPVLKLGKDRLVIGSDCSQCRLCVDLSPEENGTYGQVIFIDQEWGVALLLARSMNDFLRKFEQDLSMGKYSLAQDALDDGVQWLSATRDIDVGNWYNSPTWSYVDHPHIRRT
ncbi:SMI1/KNR4 family protein [Xanthomonas sacchari]|uniref:SMI1/KNR4 family protein n=1 Tax=Xanthomonas sacchari TaxID=56458 RepID=UPI00225E0DC3|nr:SMI1/KNR4 family protein [Xanthomonas sacchari]